MQERGIWMEQKKEYRTRLWLLAGIPGSGKSTWIRNHKNFFAEDNAIISRDQIRFALLGENDDYFSKENEVWQQYVEKTIASLKSNTDTILDATHLNEGSRGKILRALGHYIDGVEINAIVINTSLQKAIEQNNMREGRAFVPETAIRNMFSNFSMPTFKEGFDNIYIYKQNKDKNIYEILRKG